ncbi:apolipoprotein N-acyltransferase, partial [Candidatus Binatia bacterium]|nr:apolipoprotein N-acyltransferase [Candidatus Binatia bacterium]
MKDRVEPSPSTRIVLMLATVVLYGLSYPPYGSPLVAWLALVPLFLALRGLSAGHALLLAWVSGLAMAYAITDFLPAAVAYYYGQGLFFGVLLFVASVSVMCCLSHMLFALWYRWPGATRSVTATGDGRAIADVPAWRAAGAPSPLLVGAAWVVAEFIRGDLEGNPWGTIGYTQVRWLPMVQIAEWTGVYGITFVVVAMNAALADVVVQRARPRALGRVALVAMLALAVVTYGRARLAAVEAEPPGDVPIAVVQGNVDLGARWRQELYGQNLEDYLRQTRDAARHEPAQVVFWPENAVTFFLEDEALYRYAIGHVLAPLGAQLVTGGPHAEPGPPQRFYNSAFLLGRDGEVIGRYDKRVLMPFAEYYPGWLAVLSQRQFGGVREFSEGRPSPPLPTDAGPASVVTCNEALFPRTVRERVADGGGYLVNLANDGWLGVHRYSDRVLDMVAVRAIEHRRFAVRASSSGGSAIVAPSGRVLARSAPFA